MLFFFKKKKIVVDCFTWNEPAYQFWKIRKAITYYPELFKKMPSEFWMPLTESNVRLPSPTIKRCTGINELYKHGAIIPFWTDYVCQPKDAMRQQSRLGEVDSAVRGIIAEHPPKQFEGLFNNYVHIKFGGVWNLVEKTGIKFVWIPATYNLNNHIDNFIVPPGVSFYDWQCQTNLNIFVRKDSEDFVIKAGTPMVHIIPITEKEVEYKCHLVTEQEWRTKNTIPLNFPQILGTRNNRYWKEKEEAERLDKLEKKCPFGFGKD